MPTPHRAGRLAGLAFVLICLAASPLQAQFGDTASPDMEPGDTCPAIATYEWDVGSVFYLTGVTWEFKDGPFDVPDGPDPAPVEDEWVHHQRGSVTIDLRDHGPVLDGSAYHFRVIGGNLFNRTFAHPSEDVVFSRSASLEGSYQAVPTPEGAAIALSWDLPPEIAGCADRVEWRIERASQAAAEAAGAPTEVERGVVDEPSGSTTIDLAEHGPGDYRVRLVAFHGGTDPDDAVGLPGPDVPVSIAPPAPETHELAVTVVDEAASVCGVAGAAAGAVVTATGEAGTYEVEAGPGGTVVLDVPGGEYEVEVSTVAGCSPATASALVDGDRSVTIELVDCVRPHDLAVALERQGPVLVDASSEVELPVRVANPGEGISPPNVDLTVRRYTADMESMGVVAGAGLGTVCPGAEETRTFRDTPPEGTWIYGVAAGGPGGEPVEGDEDPSNDADTLRVVVAPPADLAEADDAAGPEDAAGPDEAEQPEDTGEPPVHRLTVVVEDRRGPACGTGDPVVPGASVVFGRVDSPADAIAETGPEGTAVLELSAGTWRVSARSGGCESSETVSVVVDGDRSVTLGLPNCPRRYEEPYDLALSIDLRRDVEPGGSGLAIPVRVTHVGSSGPAPPAVVRVFERRIGSVEEPAQVGTAPIGSLCPGETVIVSVVDPDPAPDEPTEYTARWLSQTEDASGERSIVIGDPEVMALDQVAANDEASTTVGGVAESPADVPLHRQILTFVAAVPDACRGDGTVTGGTVAGATVTAVGLGEETFVREATADDGGVAVLDLPAGEYQFTIQGAAGCAPRSSDVSVSEDAAYTVELTDCPYDLAVAIDAEGPLRPEASSPIDLPIRVENRGPGAAPEDARLSISLSPTPEFDEAPIEADILDWFELDGMCPGEARTVVSRDVPPEGAWIYRAGAYGGGPTADLDPDNDDAFLQVEVETSAESDDLAAADGPEPGNPGPGDPAEADAAPAPDEVTTQTPFSRRRTGEGETCVAFRRYMTFVDALVEQGVVVDGVEWRLLKNGEVVASGSSPVVTDGPGDPLSLTDLDLRQYGNVLDGTRYAFRARAMRNGEPVARWSDPAVFEEAVPLALDMFGVEPDPEAGEIAVSWDLELPLAGCANRVAFEPLGARLAGARIILDDTRGEHALPSEPGEYTVRLVALWDAAEAVEVGLASEAVDIVLPEPGPETHRLTVVVEDLDAPACDPDTIVAGATVSVSGEGISRLVDVGPDGTAVVEVPAGEYAVRPMSGECGESGGVDLTVSGDTEVELGLPECSRPYDLAVEIERQGPSLLTSPVEIDLPVRVDVVSGAIDAGKAVLLQRRREASQDFEILEVQNLGGRCAGDSERVLFRDAPPEGSWVYRAFVRRDLDPANSDDTTAITVRSPQAQVEAALPDLALDADQSVDPVVAGERVRYTIKVGNRGAAAARDVTVEGVLPLDLDLVSADATNGFACAPSPPRIRCERDALPRDEGTTVEILAELPSTTSSGRLLRFHAQATTSDDESDDTNNGEHLVATTAEPPPPPAAPPTEAYRVPASHVLRRASQRGGFVSWAIRDLPGTNCSLEWPDHELHLSFVGHETGRCVYRFLVTPDGRDLAPGWTLGRVEASFIGDDDVEFVRSGDPADPRFTITIEKSDPTGGTRFRWTDELTAITLEGPPGRDWKEAFE